MIAKEQAIEILKGDFSKVVLSENESHSELFTEAFNIAIEALNGKDTNIHSKWIPCSERLPEKDQSVLVQPRWADEKFELVIAWRSVNRWSGKDEWEHENDYFDDDEVIAWMPLPEPYKGENNG